MKLKTLLRLFMEHNHRIKDYFRIMKISFFLLFVCACQLLAVELKAQNARISISQNSLSIRQVIKDIESQTDYLVVFRNQDVDLEKVVTFQKYTGKVSEYLDEICKHTGMRYAFDSNYITLSKQGIEGAQRKKQITGKVTDEHGETIIGANVVEKGTTHGVITDLEGNFSLSVSPDATLSVSYIGYKMMDIAVAGKSNITVVLKEDSQLLDEVVVVGYGTQKKANLTGAVASVKAEDIKDRVQSDVLSSIQGTVPGVTIISRPGETPTVNIRGRGNLGTSDPLYVIDGTIADASFFSNLDPNSIESISFLKDASSASIYGSRAAYGVVLVTTKSGTKGKMAVSYNGYVGFNKPTYLPEVVDSWEYAELMNEAFYNRGFSDDRFQAYSADEIGWFKDGSRPDYYPNTKWTDLTLDQTVVTTKHSLDFSGGSEKIRYFLGLGYLYDDSFVPYKDKNRYNLNMSITSDPAKWLTLRARAKYIQTDVESEKGSLSLIDFVTIPAIMVAKQSNGDWGSMAGGDLAYQTWMQRNPLRCLDKGNWQKQKTSNTVFDLGVDIKLLEGLVITGQGIYKNYEYKNKSYTALQDDIKNFETGATIPGTGIYQNSMNMAWSSATNMLYTGTIKYDRSAGQHAIGVMAGTSYEYYKIEKLSGSRKNFPIDGLEDMEGGSSAGTDITNGAGLSEYKMLSYFGRLNYAYKDRYLFEANIRTDASSQFYKSNRWGVFPSFSLGWRMSEENFMQPIDWVNNLKLRASWGTLGNINNVGYYDYFQSYVSDSYYSFDDVAVQGIREAKPANLKLGWETVNMADIGFDLDIFDGLLGINVDYYVKNTSNILLNYNVPLEIGISSVPSQNIGKVKNTGFELALIHRNKIGKVSYTLGANIATNKNKIVDMGTSNNKIDVGSGQSVAYIYREGEPVGSYYGYKTNGLYTQEEIDAGHYFTFGRKPNAGDIKYVPQREGIEWGSEITGDDRAIIGKNIPDFTYGINLSVLYNNFELSLFGQGVCGTSLALVATQVTPFSTGTSPKKAHLARWTQANPNPQATFPRLYGGHSLDNYNTRFSEFNIFDSDYFRIKTISLGYRVPQKIITPCGLSALKAFISAENPFTIRADKKMKDFDPEARDGAGINAFGVKSIAFGVNISF